MATSPSLTRPIHLWAPDICEGTGGIQTLSRFFVKALCETYPGAKIRVITKNDYPPPGDPLLELPVQFFTVAEAPGPLRTVALAALGLFLGLVDGPAFALTTHVHFLPVLSLLRMLRGTRCAAVLHGVEAWELHGRARIQALQQADALLAVSEFTRQEVIRRFGLRPEQVDLAPNTYEVRGFSPGPKPEYLLRRYGLSPEQPVVLTVGRLERGDSYKGHREIMAALPELRRQFPAIRYVIVGDGNDRPFLEQIARERGVAQEVIFAGRVPADELADHYRLCDVFAMPSWGEGFGIVYLEAMASGKPVVAGNIDGSVDALEQGRLGALVNPKDPVQVGAAIGSFLSGKPANPHWLDPQWLAREVRETFGPARVQPLWAKWLSKLSQPSE